MVKVLVDTGIGNNIDDAFALAAAATAPSIQLLGVTTTGSDPQLRSLLARRLLGAYGRLDVSVATGGFSGRDEDPINPSSFTQKSLATRTPPLAPASPHKAAQFMAQIITAHPGITLIATAPLTNIGALLTQYPHVERHIKEIVFMGGWSSQALPEYNLANDPQAAEIVIMSGIPLVGIGYEVSLGSSLRRSHLSRLETADTPGPTFVRQLFDEWKKVMVETPPLMHDPLTVASIVKPELFEWEQTRITFDGTEGPGQGAMRRDDVRGQPIKICTGIDTMAYLDWLTGIVTSVHQDTTEPFDFSRCMVHLREAYAAKHHPKWSLEQLPTDVHTLGFVRRGHCQIHIDNEHAVAKNGSVIYVPARSKAILSTDEETEMIWLRFYMYGREDNNRLTSIDHIPGLSPYYPPTDGTSNLHALFDEIATNWVHPWPEGSLLCKTKLLEIVAYLLSIGHEIEAKGSDPATAAVMKIKLYLERNAHENVTLDDISELVNMSKYYVTRIFHDQVGMPPLTYRQKIRIRQAKKLLLSQALSVNEIAEYIGYGSVSAFSRAFQRETGMSPRQFRLSQMLHNDK